MIDIQLVFVWRRRRQRLGDVVGLVVYCPMAYDYVPHGRGRTDTNVMKEIRRRVEKNGSSTHLLVGVQHFVEPEVDISPFRPLFF